MGIRVDVLIAFAIDHNCWDWPTWQVVRDIIQPATESTRCRYADLPGMKENNYFGLSPSPLVHFCIYLDNITGKGVSTVSFCSLVSSLPTSLYITTSSFILISRLFNVVTIVFVHCTNICTVNNEQR